MKKPMRYNVVFYLFAFCIILLSACKTEKVEVMDNIPNVRPLNTREAAVVHSSNNFAFNLFSKINAAQGDQNVFISPLSISAALTMTYNGAGSSTKEAIAKTLDFTPGADEEINQSYKSVAELLTGIDKQVTFNAANSIWHRNDIQLRQDFTSQNKQYFNAVIRGLNFSDPVSRSIINSWVKEQTNGKVAEIVKEIRYDHILFLINAIYFKGNWTYQFDKKLTQDGTFFLPNGTTTTCKMMALKDAQYLYYQDAAKTIVDLPYGNKQFSMTMIMPAEGQSLETIANELNVHILQSWLAKADSSKLNLYMPKFQLAYEIQLKELLAGMGMAEAFSDTADFSRMVEGVTGGIAISEVKHKTFVEVNEEGTEAAAATSVGVVLTSMPPSVYLNRPFIFLIREKSSNTILFIGKLVNPVQ